MELLSDADRMKADSLGRKYQAEWDPIYREFGVTAPPRPDNVDPQYYNRKLAEGITRRIPNTDTKPFPGNSLTFRQIHNLEVAALERDIYRGFEDQIKSVGLAAANHPDSVGPNEIMRRVEKIDPGGVKFIQWVGALRDKNHPELGQRSFIEDFKPPVILKAKIRNPDSSPGWFTGNTRVSQAGVGMDPLARCVSQLSNITRISGINDPA
jgi:hypothetical protein